MEENIVQQEDVTGQNALCAKHYFPKEKRNLYVKSHKNFI